MGAEEDAGSALLEQVADLVYQLKALLEDGQRESSALLAARASGGRTEMEAPRHLAAVRAVAKSLLRAELEVRDAVARLEAVCRRLQLPAGPGAAYDEDYAAAVGHASSEQSPASASPLTQRRLRTVVLPAKVRNGAVADDLRINRHRTVVRATSDGEAWESEAGEMQRQLTYRQRTFALERNVWLKFHDSKDPDFFHAILIARDGGFSEVGSLWYPSRVIMALLMVVCIVSNLLVIIVNDLNAICHNVSHDQLFLLTRPVVEWVFNLVRRIFGFPASVIGSGAETICVIELLVLTCLVASGVAQAIQAARARDEHDRWRAISKIFGKILPELSSYSAMRLLHFATPSVVIADFLKFISYSQSRWQGQGQVFLISRKWLKFFVTRSFCFMIGLDCFLVKIYQRGAEHSLTQGSIGLWDVLNVCMLLMQVLGIVQLGAFVKGRLFKFIFGGEDAVLQPHEKAIKAVWNAMLVRAIWREHSCFRFTAIMMSFSDEDFQRLVLNERGDSGREHGDSPEESASGSGSSSEDGACLPRLPVRDGAHGSSGESDGCEGWLR